MPIDPVKIPQNVYVEDRIIGPITLRQIMILMVSAGISYGISATMQTAGPVNNVQMGFAWMPLVIGIAFAFVKVNDISLFRLLFLIAERAMKPGTRIWSPREGIYVNIITKESKKEPSETEKEKIQQTKEAPIDQLSEVLDNGPTEIKKSIEHVAEEEEKEEESSQTVVKKAVRKEKVQAEPRKKPIDDIRKKTPSPSQRLSGLVRDISPPPSHA